MTTAVATENPGGIPWWVPLLQGIAAVLIGIFLITNPGATTAAKIYSLRNTLHNILAQHA